MKSLHEEWKLGTSVQICGDVFTVIGLARKSGTLGATARYEIEVQERSKAEQEKAEK
jgi:hypothetical protein